MFRARPFRPPVQRLVIGLALSLMMVPMHAQESTAPSTAAANCPATTGSAAPAVASGTQSDSSTLLMQASYNTGDWSGDLKAFPVSAGSSQDCEGGNPPAAGAHCATARWSAADRLRTQDWNTGRSILSYSRAARTGIPFRFGSLDAAQIAQLKTRETEAAEPAVIDRIRYLRGDTRQDGSAATPRQRNGQVLGDIVNAAPVFVGPPSASYSDPSYAAFRDSSASRTRPPMVYAAANDGMLHAFDASGGSSGGTEKFAYVPNAAFGTGSRQPLLGLTQLPFKHEPIVDGPLQEADAKINGVWTSVLVGSLGQGGRAVYALDVSDPGAMTESSTARVLWEFTSQDDGDLGDAAGTPSIVKMRNGRWAAIFGNGHATAAEPTANGKACLFIAFLEGPGSDGWSASGGGRYRKICSGVGEPANPNGLASPAAVDVDRDPDETVDFIYAGDERGNLWRFDVNDADPVNWKVGYGGSPLFTAKDAAGNPQPITAQPEVGYNLNAAAATSASNPKLAIYFGTGRYLRFSTEPAGNTPTGIQTFYGIFDNDLGNGSAAALSPPIRRSNLRKQSIVQEVNAGGGACTGPAGNGCFRVATQNALTTTDRGWYLDLSSPDSADTATKHGAEQQVSTPILRNGRVVFTTVIPPADGCGPGSGWLMTLDARSGGRIAAPTFDTGGDRQVGRDDDLQVGGTPLTASGTRSTVGMPAAPAIIGVSTLSGVEVDQLSGSGQDGKTLDGVVQSTGARSGRISWRELQR